MFFLTGEYNHQLDDKNRIRIPRKLKDAVPSGEKLFISKGTDGCLFVLPQSTVEDKIEKIKAIKMGDSERQKGLRSFTKSIEPIEEDAQGRTVLSPVLRHYAHIKKDIKILGTGERIEIWAKEVYDKYFENEDFDFNFSTLDI